MSTSSAAAAQSRCEKANELSRQLEDILSIYCRESLSDDAGALANGQSHGLELNGLTGDKEDKRARAGKVKGGAGGGDKEPKKTQDKKKVKGLGEAELLVEVQIL